MAERAEPTLYNRREVNPRQTQVPQAGGPANLADILERVLDKGIVIAGDIQINLLDIELLTIKLRLLIASVERAQEMGINWWQSDPTLSSSAKELEQENEELRDRLERLEKAAGLPAPREGEEVIIEEHRREEIVEGTGADREEKEVAHHEEIVEDEEESPSTSRRKGSGGRKGSSGG
jgi:gas vesicle protein GvpA/GvpJ/GvpM family